MQRRQLLEVRPLLRYPAPGYPSAIGLADALRKRPEGPWPFLAPPALVSAILAASSGCGPSPASAPLLTSQPGPATQPTSDPTAATTIAVTPAPPTPSAAGPEEPAPAAQPNIGRQLGHPFSWESSGLPFSWTPYGTGAPSRLSEDQVRPVVERVLRAAGVHPVPKVPFARPGIAVELGGYDAAKHIGWVFVDWQNLEDPSGLRDGMKKVHGKDGHDFTKMISHSEILGLLELERERREHIIVINQQDDRFTTEHGKTFLHPQEPLRRLEENLKVYLRWLKSQGAL